MIEDIAHEATYPHPPEAVWRALTTPAALRSWLMDNDFAEARVGHRFRFMDKPKKIVGWDGIVHCEVLEADAPRRFVLRFGDDTGGAPTTRVEWALEPTSEGGTRLRFRHSGFSGIKGWMMRQGMNQGWGSMIRHAIPFVVHEMLAGRIPTQAETREVAKKGFRADHHAAKAKA